jgi:hypothetical protein
MIENKIARICWNTEFWRKPSGRAGKSETKKTYECRHGYGHEEWLLDMTKLIDGWHYAYVQSIGLHHQKYFGKAFNLSLYSIDGLTKDCWWLGRINDVVVTTEEESRKAYAKYKEIGWLCEMEKQLRDVGAKFSDFRNIKPEHFAVIRFRPSSLNLKKTPQKFPSTDTTVNCKRYILLNQKRTPPLVDKSFTFVPGRHHGTKSQTKVDRKRRSASVELRQNRIQTKLYPFLVKKYGEDNVATEHPAGYGSESIDAVVRDDSGNFTFYEIKTSCFIRRCIREALGQLLEYAYFPDNSIARRMVVVSPNPVTPEVQSYLTSLRDKFKIPIYYQKFDMEKGCLEDAL